MEKKIYTTEEEFKHEVVAILKKYHLMFKAYLVDDDIIRYYDQARKPTSLPASLMEFMLSLYNSSNRQLEELVQTVIRVNSYAAVEQWYKRRKING